MTPTPNPESAQATRSDRVTDLIIVLCLSLVSVGVFANGLNGDFVYDDIRQIQQNRLIEDPDLVWRALTSDVWAFKGERGASWSNYWRPTFVLYLIVNERMFGTEEPFGWHLMNILLHTVVVGLGYGLLRGLGFAPTMATCVSLLFAVHPVHVESVTWISGSPDLLMGVGLLGSLWCVVANRARPRSWLTIASLVMYAFAQLAKESAILFPALVFGTVFFLEVGFLGRRLRRAAKAAWPFFVIALAYWIAHSRIAPPIEVPWDPGLGGMILTAPRVLAFYIRQALFPFWVSPAHPLRVVESGELDWLIFTVPVAVVVGFGGWLLFNARRDRASQISLLMFAVPLVPAFYLRAFRQEEIVHDRYLYLPLLGLLACLLPAVSRLLHRLQLRRSGAIQLTVVALASVALAAQTFTYNAVWCSAEALWTRAVEVAPNASHAWSELANIHYRLHRTALDPAQQAAHLSESKRCVEKALELFPVTNAHLLRGMIARDERRFSDAVADFELILVSHPEHVLAYENLAVCHDSANQPEAAVEVLKAAREKVPHRYATWTEKIAICLYRMGRQEDVIAELEGARPRVAAEYRLVPEASFVLYRLVSIRAARKEVELARAAADEFLRLTENATLPLVLRRREEVAALRATL